MESVFAFEGKRLPVTISCVGQVLIEPEALAAALGITTNWIERAAVVLKLKRTVPFLTESECLKIAQLLSSERGNSFFDAYWQFCKMVWTRYSERGFYLG